MEMETNEFSKMYKVNPKIIQNKNYQDLIEKIPNKSSPNKCECFL